MNSIHVSLRSLRKTRFPELYTKLLLGAELDGSEEQSLLELAVLFIHADQDFVRKLGYRIVLLYSNLTGNLAPLYDVAINSGFIPVAKFIEQSLVSSSREETFFQAFQSAYKEGFRKSEIYLTEQQLHLALDLSGATPGGSVAVIAPTSYGKSELIIDSLTAKDKNICIVVPTKALIAQTKRRIVHSPHYDKKRKIITHPEMFHPADKNLVVVVTQERLLRLLQKAAQLKFDVVFIDEAHNLLEDGDRGRLLATAIILLQKRNPRTAFRFLTPFLLNHKNLETLHANLELKPLRVDEYLKSERFYCCDFLNSTSPRLEMYDQFLDQFIDVGVKPFRDDIALILAKSKRKNIAYANKPRNVERIAKKLAANLKPLESEVIARACKALAEYVHKDYFLIDCLKNGVGYHHGLVPDIVKLFVESLFSSERDIQFIVTTSTLLEGVNIPAERLFLLDYKKGPWLLSPSQFKNLVGRVCRLKEIFDRRDGNLKMLEPEIYVIASDYISQSANIKNFLQNCMKVDRKEVEEPENVLLANTEVRPERMKERASAEEFVENFSPGLIDSPKIRHAQTDFGKACFQNSIHEIDILACEKECQKVVSRLTGQNRRIDTADDAVDLINQIFLPFVAEDEDNLKRLQQSPARAFYAMLLNWRIENVSFAQMIVHFLRYWKQQRDPLVYVGRAWGDATRDGAHIPLWTDISRKSDSELVNLAIVRIKEEQDLLDNTLMKLLETLYDLELIDEGFYEKVRFGTTDQDKIALMKNGLSAALAGLLLKKYASFVRIDVAAGKVQIDPAVLPVMVQNAENDIIIFELECNVGAVE